MPEVEERLLVGHFGRRDTDEEIHFFKGAQVKVLSAGVGNGANVGEQLLSHSQLEGTDLVPLEVVT